MSDEQKCTSLNLYEWRCKHPTGCNKFRLLIFLNQLYMFRATNSPILRSAFWLYIQLLVQCTDIATDRWQGWDGTQFHLRLNLFAGRQQLYQKLYIQSKITPAGGRVCHPKHVDWLKRSINGICCILLVAYFVVLMMHGLTNITKYE